MADDLTKGMPPISDGPTQFSSKVEPDRTQEPFAVGDVVGNYRILKLLSGGGMGVVYLAWDTALNRQVAIKVPFTAPQSERHRQQIRGEIEALVKLNHPGIVPVYDLQNLRGYPCMVMEYVEGVTLDQYAGRSSMSYRAIAELVLQLAETMAHAHARHVVHRDLKPSNIIIRHDGRPVVTDFGLAYIRSAYADQGTTAPCGSPAFMSPEQTLNKPELIKPHTDVFGLGGVLYYLLTSGPPYPEDGEEQRRRASIAQFDPPRKLRKSIPRALESICLKALARDPADRFASMEEVAAALRHYLHRQQTRRAMLIAIPTLLAAGVVLALLVRPAPVTLTGNVEIHFQRAAEQGITHVLTERDVPLRTGDRIQIHARFNNSAYCALVSIDPRGKLAVLYPVDGDKRVTQDRLATPDQPDEWLPLTEPAGTETIVLVADVEPVNPHRLTGTIRGALVGTGLPALEPTCLAWFEPQGVRLLHDTARSLGPAEVSTPGSLTQLHRALSRDYRVVTGISFPHIHKRGELHDDE